ncbi:unnamed protein product [Cuscuta epithymum]|uniref:Uncharacterized protein n=1 Tax=Cuscuta epithymum TaxID=186058 RepID=A0AAV0G8I7_9ASTE|nr:unnamed protein product [Cuscuta epithymum]
MNYFFFVMVVKVTSFSSFFSISLLLPSALLVFPGLTSPSSLLYASSCLFLFFGARRQLRSIAELKLRSSPKEEPMTASTDGQDLRNLQSTKSLRPELLNDTRS